MPRSPRPENKVFDDLKPVIDEARKDIGLEGRSYRKREGDTETRLAYGVKYKGDAPHYATEEQIGKAGERITFDNPWQAIWLAIGSSDAAELEVLVKATKDAAENQEPSVKVRRVGSPIKVAAAKDIFPDRVDGEGPIVR